MVSAAPFLCLNSHRLSSRPRFLGHVPASAISVLPQDSFHRASKTQHGLASFNNAAPGAFSPLIFSPQVAPITFGAVLKKEINGYSVNRMKYLSLVKLYQAQLKPTIAQWQTIEWGKDNPSIQMALNNVKLPDWVGIPPAIAYLERGQAKNTHGALAQLFLKLLEDSPLPPSDSMEAGLAKVVATLRALNIPAVRSAQELKKGVLIPIRPIKHVDTPGVTTTNLWSLPFKDKALTMIFNRHFLVIAPNGAIEIYNIPVAQGLRDMIQGDPVLKDEKRFTLDYLYYTKRQLDEMIDYPDRYLPRPDYPSRWSIGNAIFESFSFDYPFLIRNGLLQVALSLPGKDGKTVWEAIPSLSKGPTTP